MKKRKTTGMLWIFAVLCLVLLGTDRYQEYKKESAEKSGIRENIAGKIIRFHVRANSDAALDQEIKLKVRDAVGAYMQPLLTDVSDIQEGRGVIENHLSQIEAEAEKVLLAEGCKDSVKAELGVTKFPEKTYGDYTFPAGDYEALEVVIGDGEGHNWWCVMYPNLCFFNSTYEVVDEEAEKSLEQVLTQEEYKSLMEHKNYEIKFGMLEWIKEKLDGYVKDNSSAPAS